MSGAQTRPPRSLATVEMPFIEVHGKRWYRTWDVASRDEDGWYWYIGRADDIFKRWAVRRQFDGARRTAHGARKRGEV
jgi:hypothetical protein